VSSVPSPIPEIQSDESHSPSEVAPQGNSPARGWRLLFRRLVGATARTTGISLVDQTVVSGTSFLTTILIGRTCSAKELGLYSLGFSLLLVALTALQTLVMAAYTIHSPRREGRAHAELAGIALAQCLILSVAATLVMALAAGVAGCLGNWDDFGVLLGSLAVIVPPVLLREFCRRRAFAHMRMDIALGLDATVASLQLGALAALIVGRSLSAISAYFVLGAACGVGGLACLAATRPAPTLCWGQALPFWRRNAALGGWFFADQLFAVMNGYFSHWLLAGMLGTATTGAYAACMSLVLFSNPFILGLGNVLMPRTARACAEGGIAEVHRVVRWATLSIVPVMAVFCSILTVFGSQLLHLLYGANYDGYGRIVAVLAWAGCVSSLGIPLTYSCLAAERADVLLWTKAVRFAAGLAASVFLIRTCNDPVMGAALGLLLGETAGLLSMFLYSRRVLASVDRGRRPDPLAEPRS